MEEEPCCSTPPRAPPAVGDSPRLPASRGAERAAPPAAAAWGRGTALLKGPRKGRAGARYRPFRRRWLRHSQLLLFLLLRRLVRARRMRQAVSVPRFPPLRGLGQSSARALCLLFPRPRPPPRAWAGLRACARLPFFPTPSAGCAGFGACALLSLPPPAPSPPPRRAAAQTAAPRARRGRSGPAAPWAPEGRARPGPAPLPARGSCAVRRRPGPPTGGAGGGAGTVCVTSAGRDISVALRGLRSWHRVWPAGCSGPGTTRDGVAPARVH